VVAVGATVDRGEAGVVALACFAAASSACDDSHDAPASAAATITRTHRARVMLTVRSYVSITVAAAMMSPPPGGRFGRSTGCTLEP
jgi:hypothetical protein